MRTEVIDVIVQPHYWDKMKDRQKKILVCLWERLYNSELPPSTNELKTFCDIPSGCTVFNYIETLQDWGIVKKEKFKCRTLTLVEGQSVPIVKFTED